MVLDRSNCSRMLLKINIIHLSITQLTRIIKSHHVIGTFLQCILSAQCDTYKLINLLFDEFESYGDETIFEGSMGNFLLLMHLQKFENYTCDKHYQNDDRITIITNQ